MTPTKYTWRQFWTNRYVPAKSRCTPAQRVALWVLPALYIGAAVLFAWMILAGVKLAHDAWFKATHATSSATHGHWRSGIAVQHAVKTLSLRLAADIIGEQQREAAEREAIRSAAVDDCLKRGGWPVEGLALYTVCVKESATVK